MRIVTVTSTEAIQRNKHQSAESWGETQTPQEVSEVLTTNLSLNILKVTCALGDSEEDDENYLSC